ncbi:hypothetical protein BLNAU_13104 [Blattamonas nauphoetae]|uniref:Uncharacterized protein n=1 Tax=Blattamonas nauphoetae TaxID=2049346 RepID=A0ABQ9XKK4_9EUKA|nr:hypothetical protein BLNAU_13104 [Blattamonas nauphoetae]
MSEQSILSKNKEILITLVTQVENLNESFINKQISLDEYLDGMKDTHNSLSQFLNQMVNAKAVILEQQDEIKALLTDLESALKIEPNDSKLLSTNQKLLEIQMISENELTQIDAWMEQAAMLFVIVKERLTQIQSAFKRTVTPPHPTVSSTSSTPSLHSPRPNLDTPLVRLVKASSDEDKEDVVVLVEQYEKLKDKKADLAQTIALSQQRIDELHEEKERLLVLKEENTSKSLKTDHKVSFYDGSKGPNPTPPSPRKRPPNTRPFSSGSDQKVSKPKHRMNQPDFIEVPRLSKPAPSISPYPLTSTKSFQSKTSRPSLTHVTKSEVILPTQKRERQSMSAQTRSKTPKGLSVSVNATRASTKRSGSVKTGRASMSSLASLQIDNEEDARKMIASFEQRKAEAIATKDFRSADKCQKSILKLKETIGKSRVDSVEARYQERMQTITAEHTKEKEALDLKWKRNFQRHTQTAEHLRIQMKAQGEYDIRIIQQEDFDNGPKYHPSKALLELKVKLDRSIKANQFVAAEKLQKDYDHLLNTEQKQFEADRNVRLQRRIDQQIAKQEQSMIELERRIQEDHAAMMKVKDTSYQELHHRFQLIKQTEADTHSIELQKLSRQAPV